MPLVYSMTSRGYRHPCGLSLSASILGLLWIMGLSAVLLLRFLPPSPKGTRTREWREGAVAAMGLGLLFLAFTSAFYVLYYCLCVRRRIPYVDSDEPSI